MHLGRDVSDVKRFSNRVFTLPFDALSPGDGDIFDIRAVRRTRPNIPGTVTGFFMLKSQLARFPDSFSIDY